MSDFFANTDWLGTGLNFLSDLGTNITNGIIANKNLAFQKDAFNYQKELNNLAMQREDNAVQRRMQDLASAGLSPYLAAGSAASSSSLSTGSAPQNPFMASFKNDYNFMTKKQRELLSAQVEEAQARASMESNKAKYSKDNPAMLFQDNFFNRLQFGVNMLDKLGIDVKSIGNSIVDGLGAIKTGVDHLTGNDKPVPAPPLSETDKKYIDIYMNHKNNQNKSMDSKQYVALYDYLADTVNSGLFRKKYNNPSPEVKHYIVEEARKNSKTWNGQKKYIKNALQKYRR